MTKTLVTLTLLALCLTARGQQVVSLSGKVNQQWEQWLTIEVEDKDFKSLGVQPATMRILSKYHPVWRKTPLGDYEIMFVTK